MRTAPHLSCTLISHSISSWSGRFKIRMPCYSRLISLRSGCLTCLLPLYLLLIFSKWLFFFLPWVKWGEWIRGDRNELYSFFPTTVSSVHMWHLPIVTIFQLWFINEAQVQVQASVLAKCHRAFLFLHQANGSLLKNCPLSMCWRLFLEILLDLVGIPVVFLWSQVSA